MRFLLGLFKFFLGLIFAILIIVSFRLGTRYIVWNYGINTLWLIYGSAALVIILIIFIYGYAQKNKKEKLIAEGKWVEAKKEQVIANEIETPKPNTKAILIIGAVALMLLLGFSLYLIES